MPIVKLESIQRKIILFPLYAMDKLNKEKWRNIVFTCKNKIFVELAPRVDPTKKKFLRKHQIFLIFAVELECL